MQRVFARHMKSGNKKRRGHRSSPFPSDDYFAALSAAMAALTLAFRRDFLRAAAFLWIMPFRAAVSITLCASRRAMSFWSVVAAATAFLQHHVSGSGQRHEQLSSLRQFSWSLCWILFAAIVSPPVCVIHTVLFYHVSLSVARNLL